MFTSLPRDTLLEVLTRSELEDIQKVCVVSRIVLSEKELDSISRVFNLPYIRRSQPGLLYLLKCSKLNKRELVNEFLVNDDSRVLEVTSMEQVANGLFPLTTSEYIKGEVHDCPSILLTLLEKEEWNSYIREET